MYRCNFTRMNSWNCDAKQDQYVDPSKVVFQYLRHDQRKDHATGFVYQFDYYQAKEYDTPGSFWYSQTHISRQRYRA